MMTDFLLVNEAVVLSIGFYGSLLLVIFWETFSPRRRLSKPTWIRWLNNAGLWLINTALLQWLVFGVALSITLYAEQHEIGLLRILSPPEPVAIIVGMLLLDFLSTVKHRLFHEVPLLWRVHLVHHSDLDCDVSTSLRLHPLDVLIDYILWIMIVIAVGASPVTVVLYYFLEFSLNSIRHGNVCIPDRIERFLRMFIVTPDFHRTHHSSIKRETNSNYGVIYPWWDWLMQTYCAEPVRGQQGMTIGLEYFRSDVELWLPKILAQPFRRQALNNPTTVGVNEEPTTTAIK